MNEKQPAWHQVLIIGFFWILSGGLGLIILALGREVVLVVGVQSLNMSRWVAPFVNNAYYFLAGLIWLGMFLYAEAYFSQGFKKNTLFQRIFRYLGIEILIIAVLQIILLLYRSFPLSPVGMLLVLLEVVIGVGMLLLPRYLHIRRTRTLS